MKKITLILLTFLSLSAYSQKFGFKGGLNLGKEKATDSGITITTQTRTSFLLGFYSEFSASDNLFFAPELIYSQDGGEFNSFGTSAVDKLGYLSVPVLLKYYASEKFSIHGGPQIGFLLNAETEVDGVTEDTKEFIKSTNFSFDFGGELHLTDFNLGFRYVLGLSDISDIPDSTTKVRLNTIQIYAGFPLN